MSFTTYGRMLLKLRLNIWYVAHLSSLHISLGWWCIHQYTWFCSGCLSVRPSVNLSVINRLRSKSTNTTWRIFIKSNLTSSWPCAKLIYRQYRLKIKVTFESQMFLLETNFFFFVKILRALLIQCGHTTWFVTSFLLSQEEHSAITSNMKIAVSIS